jgi:hypothetical protein
MSADGHAQLGHYLKLLERRATAELPTAATFMRRSLKAALGRRRTEAAARRASLGVDLPPPSAEAARADARATLRAAVCETVDECRRVSVEAAAGALDAAGPTERALLGDLRVAVDRLRARRADAPPAAREPAAAAAREILRSERLPAAQVAQILARAHELRREAAAAEGARAAGAARPS